MTSGKLLVYGGKGALGSAVVKHFQLRNWWIRTVDFYKGNQEEEIDIIIDEDHSLEEQRELVRHRLMKELGKEKLDAVVCVAGGWSGENEIKHLIKTTDDRWRDCVWGPLISADVAKKYLRRGGLLTLTGARSALRARHGMVSYGMAKGAVHHLVKSLGRADSGMPIDSVTIGILPAVLDTSKNRLLMPRADRSQWTPLSYMTDLFDTWVTKEDTRPLNGSLMEIITVNNQTKVNPVNLVSVRDTD